MKEWVFLPAGQIETIKGVGDDQEGVAYHRQPHRFRSVIDPGTYADYYQPEQFKEEIERDQTEYTQAHRKLKIFIIFLFIQIKSPGHIKHSGNDHGHKIARSDDFIEELFVNINIDNIWDYEHIQQYDVYYWNYFSHLTYICFT